MALHQLISFPVTCNQMAAVLFCKAKSNILFISLVFFRAIFLRMWIEEKALYKENAKSILHLLNNTMIPEMMKITKIPIDR